MELKCCHLNLKDLLFYFWSSTTMDSALNKSIIIWIVCILICFDPKWMPISLGWFVQPFDHMTSNQIFFFLSSLSLVPSICLCCLLDILFFFVVCVWFVFRVYNFFDDRVKVTNVSLVLHIIILTETTFVKRHLLK